MAVSDFAADPAFDPDSAAPAPQASQRRTPPLLVWFGRLGIRARIAIGFGTALVLLVIVAGASIHGIQGGGAAFETYDRITVSNQRLQQFERDMLDLRRNLLLFIERDDPRGLLATRRLEPQMTENLDGMIASIRDAERRALLTEAAPLLKGTFAKLAQAIAARNALKSVTGNQLDVYGPRTRESLMQLIKAANKRQNFIAATEAGLVLDAFSEIRVAATRFIAMGDMAMANEARGKVGTFVDMIEDLKIMLDEEELKKLATEAENFAKQYEAGILAAVTAAGDINRLVYQEMEQEIAQIVDRLEQAKTGQLAILATQRDNAVQTFATTFITVMAVSIIALVIGALFAWLIGRNIANPIAALTEAMAVLAKGDFTTAVPGLQRGDEIGRMAAAVAVFKQNGAENEQLRQAVEQERHSAEQTRSQQEALLDRAVGEIVTAAAAGDLNQRIDTAPLDGVAVRLGTGINRLLDAIGGAITEVGAVLAGLAAGDLTRRVTGDYAGVFAKLQGDVNMAGETLADTMRQVAMSASTVRDASAEISTGSQDLAQRTEAQAAALEETAASMHEVTATVKLNADNAQAANQLAAVARDTAEKGGSVVANAVTAVSQIETSAQKISDIVSLIDEIAFQTNLLALNA
ncbi:methyl-accepting chemotaxis protein, partial [Ferrovibrio terrae]|uniref:methyl-accepting chemotaxis protein n=1 Tax=Ferrovibrio terrae TaxID=2594003 RepID=UPI003137BB80